MKGRQDIAGSEAFCKNNIKEYKPRRRGCLFCFEVKTIVKFRKIGVPF